MEIGIVIRAKRMICMWFEWGMGDKDEMVNVRLGNYLSPESQGSNNDIFFLKESIDLGYGWQ